MKLQPTQKSLGSIGEYSTSKYDVSFNLIFDISDQKYFVHEHGLGVSPIILVLYEKRVTLIRWFIFSACGGSRCGR